MLNQLPITELSAYVNYFPGPQLRMVAASIVEGNTAAQLWISDTGGLLLWDKGNNVFYFSGQLTTDPDAAAFAKLFATEIRAQAIKEGARYFKVRLLSEGLEPALPALFQGIELREAHSLFYRFDQAAPLPAPAPQMAGVDFALIDGAFLARTGLANMEEVRGEIRWMWPSEEQFLANGFGYAAVAVDRILCWCTAEYVSRDRCGIGITTDPEFEGRGLATATAARFVAESLRRGIVPHWESDHDNLASVRVAEKVGFTLAEVAHGWAGLFPPE
jgi:RimJ/RimL family protein N-acetyltransferase